MANFAVIVDVIFAIRRMFDITTTTFVASRVTIIWCKLVVVSVRISFQILVAVTTYVEG
jgi:hypothetical protein